VLLTRAPWLAGPRGRQDRLPGMLPIVVAALGVWCTIGGCCSDCDLPSEVDPDCCEEEIDRTATRGFGALNDFFARRGGGWTGGLGGHSVELSESKIAWLFGESFVDTVFSDFTRPANSAVVENAIVLTMGEHFETIVDTSASSPRALFRPLEKGLVYIPRSARVEGSTLEVVCGTYSRTGDGIFDIFFVRTDLIVLSLEDWSTISRQTVAEGSPIVFGSALLEDGGRAYVYGKRDFLSEVVGELNKRAYVARTAGTSLLGEWEYFDGEGWSKAWEDAVPIADGVSDEFSVFFAHDRFYMLTKLSPLYGDIVLNVADDPTGPWSFHKLVWEDRGGNQSRITFNAKIHPGMSSEIELVVSYNSSSFSRSRIYDSFSLHRPIFLRVTEWE